MAARPSRRFRSPKGTRDFYPQDMLRRRYLTEAWRAVSLRHGFEEIDGPTFEHLDLFTVKSGDEIVSQLFSFRREGGDDTYALRPEFTPTLARMYAEKANTLSKPVRWFSVLPYFRAERPQRGRLREFLQWNCDVIGDDTLRADADVIGCAASSLEQVGFVPSDAHVAISTRMIPEGLLLGHGVLESNIDRALCALDRVHKVEKETFIRETRDAGLSERDSLELHWLFTSNEVPAAIEALIRLRTEEDPSIAERAHLLSGLPSQFGLDEWCNLDISVVRGLAYYTGTVFEVIAEGERAVAGGGRYDNLIELLGGPPTPAVGFAMGDVVLTNLLDDKGLMPGAGGDAAELPEAVEAMLRAQRLRPEVFVIPSTEENDEHVVPLVATLRRGVENSEWREGGIRPWQTERRYAVRPLHARSSDKSTRTLKKLLADAQKQGARFAAVIHGPDKVQLKDLDAREDLPGSFSIDPDADTYVGARAAAYLDHTHRTDTRSTQG